MSLYGFRSIGRPVDVVYLDFEKAFDRPKVPHSLKVAKKLRHVKLQVMF